MVNEEVVVLAERSWGLRSYTKWDQKRHAKKIQTTLENLFSLLFFWTFILFIYFLFFYLFIFRRNYFNRQVLLGWVYFNYIIFIFLFLFLFLVSTSRSKKKKTGGSTIILQGWSTGLVSQRNAKTNRN